MEAVTSPTLLVPELLSKSSRKGLSEAFTEDDIRLVFTEIGNTIIYFAECGYASFLSRLGIIFPIEKLQQRVSSVNQQFSFIEETTKSLKFEKTDDIYTSHRIQFPQLLETSELSQRVFEKTRSFLSFSATSLDLKKLVKALIDEIKRKVVRDAIVEDFFGLGSLFALHNRQGIEERDWYAGADISLSCTWNKVIQGSPSRFIEAPVLDSAFEISDLILGNPVADIDLNLHKQISSLEFDTHDLLEIIPTFVKLRSYIKPISPNRYSVTFVSEGIRTISSNLKKELGNEFIVKTVLYHRDQDEAFKLSSEMASSPLPWVLNLFAGGSLLAALSRNGLVSKASALPVGKEELQLPQKSELSTIVTFPFRTIGYRQESTTGPFYFSHLSLLTDAEASFLVDKRKSLILHFLQQRGYEQTSQPDRPDLTNKTMISKIFC